MVALPNCPQLWHQLGQTLFLRRRFDEAEAAQQRAIEIAGENAPNITALAWNDLSAIHSEKKNYPQAAEMLKRAISLTPPGAPHAVMLANAALLQMKMGQHELAVQGFANSLAEIEAALGHDHPDVGAIVESYADALRQAKRKGEAKAMLKRAESIRSGFSAQTNSGRATVDWRDLK
jgi:tetratricopeptide (TPR) repeat protein